MDIGQIDVKMFSLIAAGTLALIGALKKSFPAWVGGKEELLALALPVAFVVIAKLCGGLHGTEWVDALLKAVGAGVASGAAHDYILNPIIKNKAGDAGTVKP